MLPASRAARPRAGITLLEVLFSMFIMAVGILSIASLIPVAKSLIRDGVHSDKATALGLSTLAHVRDRGYLVYADAEPWTDTNADGVPDAAEYTDSNGNGQYDAFPYGVIFDPLALAHPSNSNASNPDSAALASFPYTTPIGSGTPPYGLSPFQRTTPFPFALGTSGALAAENFAARMFGSTDELPFAIPEDTALRPTRMYQPGIDLGWGVAGTDDDGDGDTDEQDEAGWLNSDDTSTLTPEYTCVVSVMPNLVVDNPTTPLVEAVPDVYRVSVAVFYKRDTLLPLAGSELSDTAERMLYADIIGSGLSGGDFRLRGVDDTTPADQLKVRPNEWIALIGWRTADTTATSVSIPGGTTGYNAPFLFWYRVLGAGEVDPAYDVNGTPVVGRDVTLTGPDLVYRLSDGTVLTGSGVDDDDDVATDPVPYDADGDLTNGLTFQVAVFTNCVGVYEKVIRND